VVSPLAPGSCPRGLLDVGELDFPGGQQPQQYPHFTGDAAIAQ
jgi:hypothetical protein